MSTSTVSGEEVDTGEGDASEPRVEYLPPAGHDTVAAIERTYARQEGLCAACGESVSAGDSVHDHLYTNDFSQRSAVALCPKCRSRDGWREAVINRRRRNAGRARGWIIDQLRGYSTQAIRAAAVASAGVGIAVVSLLAVLVGGMAGTAVGPVSAMPEIGVVGGCLLAVSIITAWHRVDPRGYIVRDRPPWYTTAAFTVAGLALVAIGVPAPPAWVVESATSALWIAAWWALVGIVAAGIVLTMGRTVRADEARGTLVVNRTAIVSAVWVAFIVGLGSAIVGAPGVGNVPISVAAGAPALVSLVYLTVRARYDSRLHDQCIMLYDEVEDLLFGGPW